MKRTYVILGATISSMVLMASEAVKKPDDDFHDTPNSVNSATNSVQKTVKGIVDFTKDQAAAFVKEKALTIIGVAAGPAAVIADMTTPTSTAESADTEEARAERKAKIEAQREKEEKLKKDAAKNAEDAKRQAAEKAKKDAQIRQDKERSERDRSFREFEKAMRSNADKPMRERTDTRAGEPFLNPNIKKA